MTDDLEAWARDAAEELEEISSKQCNQRFVAGEHRYWCMTCEEYGGDDGCASERADRLLERARALGVVHDD